MKHMVKRVMFVVFFSCAQPSYGARISFDSLPSVSWFSKALDACMSAWGDLQQARAMHNDECVLLAHVTIGRLSYVQFCLEQWRKQEGVSVDAHDSAYLDRIIDVLAQAYTKHIDCSDQGYVECIDDTIKKIKKILIPIPQFHD